MQSIKLMSPCSVTHSFNIYGFKILIFILPNWLGTVINANTVDEDQLVVLRTSCAMYLMKTIYYDLMYNNVCYSHRFKSV